MPEKHVAVDGVISTWGNGCPRYDNFLPSQDFAMSPELTNLCRLLRSAAAREILPRFRRVAAQAKPDGSLVTEADLGVQAFTRSELEVSYPGVPFLGEEMSAQEQLALLADAPGGIWCLDPLDGTSNYVGGFPYFCISLALLQGGQARLGLVLDPVRDECFAAESGAGAWLNGIPLHPPCGGEDLGDCLAIVDLKRLPESLLSRLGNVAPYRSLRSLGSVALEWCWLASGRARLYLHGGQRLWDYAAGRLIATEAGIRSLLLEQGRRAALDKFSLNPRMAVAAANPVLLQHWSAWLAVEKDSFSVPKAGLDVANPSLGL
jgi:myo-inositol-1(or 4)-monophosphatase